MSTGGQIQPPSSDGTVRQALIARDDLIARLDHMTARQVTIISAPAGSGKTSLLHAWAERPGPAGRLVVVPVRRDQHDAQLFWLDLLNVVRQALGTVTSARRINRPNGPWLSPNLTGWCCRSR